MTDQQVGEWVKARRMTLKLSVTRAATAADISRTAWYGLEAGLHPPSTDTQAGVAKALEVHTDWYDRLVAGGKPRSLKPVRRALAAGASTDDLREIRLILAHLEDIAENVMEAMSAIPELAARLQGPTPSQEAPTDHAGS